MTSNSAGRLSNVPCLGSGDVSRCSKEVRGATAGDRLSVSVVSIPSPSSLSMDWRSLRAIIPSPDWLWSVFLRWESDDSDLRPDWTNTEVEKKEMCHFLIQIHHIPDDKLRKTVFLFLKKIKNKKVQKETNPSGSLCQCSTSAWHEGALDHSGPCVAGINWATSKGTLSYWHDCD